MRSCDYTGIYGKLTNHLTVTFWIGFFCVANVVDGHLVNMLELSFPFQSLNRIPWHQVLDESNLFYQLLKDHLDKSIIILGIAFSEMLKVYIRKKTTPSDFTSGSDVATCKAKQNSALDLRP